MDACCEFFRNKNYRCINRYIVEESWSKSCRQLIQSKPQKCDLQPKAKEWKN